ncbi:MAG: ABC transporter substrate-binding protein [Methanomicrobiales archaeon]|nr:ABC transporter substrate-binding protein [Methanomicrobiales archaeon]
MRVPALLCLLLLLVSAVSAALPLDLDGDGRIAEDELYPIALDYLLQVHGRLQENPVLQREVQDAAFVVKYWNGTQREVKDSAGNAYMLERPLGRVVVMNSETLETMRSIGVNSRVVVGVDKYTLQKPDFFPEYTRHVNVGSIWAPDYEKILSLKPDAVFLYATISPDSTDAIVRTLGSTMPSAMIFRFDGYKPATYRREVEALMEIFGAREKGVRYLAFYDETIGEITKHTAGIPEDARMRVYLETWTDFKTGGQGSGYHEKIEMAGGTNIFGEETTEYPAIDPEAVLKRTPQVIVKLVGTGDYRFGGYREANTTRYAQTYEALLKRPGWSTLEAVREGRVHLMHTDIMGGPQFIVGTAYLAKWLYPEDFPSLEPEEIHLRYVHEFQGMPEDLVEDRVFVYP